MMEAVTGSEEPVNDVIGDRTKDHPGNIYPFCSPAGRRIRHDNGRDGLCGECGITMEVLTGLGLVLRFFEYGSVADHDLIRGDEDSLVVYSGEQGIRLGMGQQKGQGLGVFVTNGLLVNIGRQYFKLVTQALQNFSSSL